MGEQRRADCRADGGRAETSGSCCAVLTQVPRIEMRPKEMKVTGGGAGGRPPFVSLPGRPGCDLAAGGTGGSGPVAKGAPLLRVAHPLPPRGDPRDRCSGPCRVPACGGYGGPGSPRVAPVGAAAGVGEADGVEGVWVRPRLPTPRGSPRPPLLPEVTAEVRAVGQIPGRLVVEPDLSERERGRVLFLFNFSSSSLKHSCAEENTEGC